MTAQCTPYGCPQNFRDSLTTPMAIVFTKFFMGFCFDCAVRAKFQVRSFTRSRDNLGSPSICQAPYSPKFLMGFSSDGSYECTCLQCSQKKFRLQFWVGVANPKSRERETVVGRGWYRSKEGWRVRPSKFQCLHSNFSSVFTRFRQRRI